jgi:hypothetical protein
MASRSVSGGGINSNKVVQRREATREQPRTRGVNPGGADQHGAHMTKESAATPLYGGPSFAPVKFGNELATNVGAGGPGAGRTTLRAGSQAQHGPVAQGDRSQAPDVPATRPGQDQLRDFGPERGRR